MCPLGASHGSELVSGLDVMPPDITKDRTLSSVSRSTPIPRARWRNRDGKFIETPDYYHGVHVDRLSWLNGRTVFDRYECATIGCWSWVDHPSARCTRCVPSSGVVVPSLGSITRAHRLKMQGDARSVFDLAVMIQEQIRGEFARVDQAGREASEDEGGVVTRQWQRELEVAEA